MLRDDRVQSGSIAGLQRDRCNACASARRRAFAADLHAIVFRESRSSVSSLDVTVRSAGMRRSIVTGTNQRGVLRVAGKFRSCICRRYSAQGAGVVAVIIARTTMTHATNSPGRLHGSS
jgi:hypothetical protein